MAFPSPLEGGDFHAAQLVKAPPEAQQRLLDLQELDTTLEQLAHRRRSVPELAEIAEREREVKELRDATASAETEAGDLAREQSKAEADVDQVRTRADRDQKRLDSGQVGSPRELENLQSEIASLQHRQAELEDVVLEVMERREQAESRGKADQQQREQAGERLAELEQRRDEAFADIDEQAAAKKKQRDELAGTIPEDLLALYERLRAQTGIGAAAFHRGRCEGCHLTLNNVDLNRIRTAEPDEVVRCEECRRILVRPEQAGEPG